MSLESAGLGQWGLTQSWWRTLTQDPGCQKKSNRRKELSENPKNPQGKVEDCARPGESGDTGVPKGQFLLVGPSSESQHYYEPPQAWEPRGKLRQVVFWSKRFNRRVINTTDRQISARSSEESSNSCSKHQGLCIGFGGEEELVCHYGSP